MSGKGGNGLDMLAGAVAERKEERGRKEGGRESGDSQSVSHTDEHVQGGAM